MKYDFTTVLDRRGHDILAAEVIPFDGVSVREGFTSIPMWVADMSFPTAPFILEAIGERLRFPNFGYFMEPETYFQAIIGWHRDRKKVYDLSADCIGYENGVLGGFSSALRAFSSPGDPVLLHSPTYIGFSHVLEDTGRKAVHSPLIRDESGIWRMDFEDMDRKLKEQKIHLAVFCSPHNPAGRVWEAEEIRQAMDIFRANHCIVISDEIWSDIIMPGYSHIPTQSISEDAKSRTIALYAPSKTFSLAGLIGSYHVVYDEMLRDRLRREGSLTHYNSQNVLSMAALIGAYTKGSEWVDELCAVLDENARYAVSFIRDSFPGVKVMQPQGTYMLFLDCSKWCADNGVSIRELQQRGIMAGVIWQDGSPFFWPDSIRMNLALPNALLHEAMNRLKKYVFSSAPMPWQA